MIPSKLLEISQRHLSRMTSQNAHSGDNKTFDPGACLNLSARHCLYELLTEKEAIDVGRDVAGTLHCLASKGGERVADPPNYQSLSVKTVITVKRRQYVAMTVIKGRSSQFDHYLWII